MKPRHQVSKGAVDLIKRFEGYRRTSARLADGRWTIGYGHTKTAREGVEIIERDAEALLIYDLLNVTAAVNDLTFTPLTQNQFDALVCFTFNIGVENFRRSSVLRRINEGNLLQAAAGLEMWRKADFEGERIVIDALVRRRAAEKGLFLTPMEGYVPAPSPVLPPRVDYDAASAQPASRPVQLVSPLDGAVAIARLDPNAVPVPASDQDADNSPIAAAADAVSARLQAINLDEQTAVVVAPEPDVKPVSGPEPIAVEVEDLDSTEATEAVVEPEALRPHLDFVLTPPPMELTANFEAVQPEAEPVAEPESEPLPFDAPPPPPYDYVPPSPVAANADLSRRIISSNGAEPIFDAPFEGEQAEPLKFNWLPMVGLLLFGVLSFGFAIYWGLITDKSQGGLFGPMTVTWVAAALGVGCIVAAYFLLTNKLGGPEE